MCVCGSTNSVKRFTDVFVIRLREQIWFLRRWVRFLLVHHRHEYIYFNVFPSYKVSGFRRPTVLHTLIVFFKQDLEG